MLQIFAHQANIIDQLYARTFENTGTVQPLKRLQHHSLKKPKHLKQKSLPTDYQNDSTFIQGQICSDLSTVKKNKPHQKETSIFYTSNKTHTLKNKEDDVKLTNFTLNNSQAAKDNANQSTKTNIDTNDSKTCQATFTSKCVIVDKSDKSDHSDFAVTLVSAQSLKSQRNQIAQCSRALGYSYLHGPVQKAYSQCCDICGTICDIIKLHHQDKESSYAFHPDSINQTLSAYVNSVLKFNAFYTQALSKASKVRTLHRPPWVRKFSYLTNFSFQNRNISSVCRSCSQLGKRGSVSKDIVVQKDMNHDHHSVSPHQLGPNLHSPGVDKVKAYESLKTVNNSTSNEHSCPFSTSEERTYSVSNIQIPTDVTRVSDLLSCANQGVIGVCHTANHLTRVAVSEVSDPGKTSAVIANKVKNLLNDLDLLNIIETTDANIIPTEATHLRAPASFITEEVKNMTSYQEMLQTPNIPGSPIATPEIISVSNVEREIDDSDSESDVATEFTSHVILPDSVHHNSNSFAESVTTDNDFEISYVTRHCTSKKRKCASQGSFHSEKDNSGPLARFRSLSPKLTRIPPINVTDPHESSLLLSSEKGQACLKKRHVQSRMNKQLKGTHCMMSRCQETCERNINRVHPKTSKLHSQIGNDIAEKVQKHKLSMLCKNVAQTKMKSVTACQPCQPSSRKRKYENVKSHTSSKVDTPPVREKNDCTSFAALSKQRTVLEYHKILSEQTPSSIAFSPIPSFKNVFSCLHQMGVKAKEYDINMLQTVMPVTEQISTNTYRKVIPMSHDAPKRDSHVGGIWRSIFSCTY